MNELTFVLLFLENWQHSLQGWGLGFASAQDRGGMSSESAGVDRALKHGRDVAEIFTLPNEQFLILPEGRFSPAKPLLLRRGGGGGGEESCGKGF